MNVQNLLNQFMGASQPTSASHSHGNVVSGLSGGLMGGAAAGGIAALVLGNKKARKVAGKAATVGGGVLLGGLAYSAYRRWQQTKSGAGAFNQPVQQISASKFEAAAQDDKRFQFTLIKAMIAAAKADGQIDETEQERIFDTVESLELSADEKGMVLDLLRYPSSINELAQSASSLEQKTEVYLISCFAIDPDHHKERQYLDELKYALKLPDDLARQLEQQAEQAVLQAA